MWNERKSCLDLMLLYALCVQVVLSCKVNKINKKGYSQNRILLITDRGIYNLVRENKRVWCPDDDPPLLMRFPEWYTFESRS